MSKLPNPSPTEPKVLSVEQLLRFKKAERPDEAFWDNFDRELQQKLFQTVVERRSTRIRNWFSAILHSRSAFAMPVLAALMIVMGIALTRSGPAGSSPVSSHSGSVDMVVSVEAPARRMVSSVRESFIVDRLNLNAESSGFRKVMASQAMRLSPASTTRYVADQLDTTVRSGVLSASNTF